MKRRLPCRCCVVLLSLLITMESAQAQKQYNIWYLGKEMGLDFNSTPPQKISEPPGNVYFDIQTMADRATGQLLFYYSSVFSDPDSLSFRTADHLPMPNWHSAHLNHSYHYNSRIIVPRPGHDTQYYLFYRAFDNLHEKHKLFYLLVDMNLNGGKGDILACQRNIELDILNSTTPSILTATGACARDEYWLVTRSFEKDNNDVLRTVMKAYRIGRHSIDPAVVTKVDKVLFDNYWGTLKFSPDGTMLAHTDRVRVDNSYQSIMVVYNFDQNSGIFSLAYTLILEAETKFHHFVAGFSFSPDNSKLYSTVQFTDHDRKTHHMKIVQFDLHSGSEQQIQVSRTEVAHLEGTHYWGNTANGMQLGPDRKIYVRTGRRPLRLSVIQSPNAAPADCKFDANDIVFDKSVNPINDQHSMPNIIESDMIGHHGISLSVRAGADTTICTGEDFRLPAEAEGAVRFRWEPPAGLDDPTLLNPVASPSETTTYTLRAWNSRECSVHDTVRITVLKQSKLELSADTTICPGGSVQLAAQGARYYAWSPTAGLNKTNGPGPVAAPDTTTTYTVLAYDDPYRRCGVSKTITVTVAPLPESYAGEDIGLCRGDTVQLQATGGARYRWTPAHGLSDRNSASPAAYPTKSTQYMVEVFNTAGCSAVDTLEVFVSEPIELQLAQDEYSICRGTEVQLQASGAEEYRWTPTDGLSDPGSPTPLARPLATTVYTLVATKEHCSVEAQVRVIVNSLPGIEATADTSICAGETLQLWARGGDRYEWSGPDLDDANSARPLATPAAPAEYIVKVYNTDGCYGFDTVRVGFRETLDLTSEQADYTICAGESVRLGVSGAERYEWTPTEGLDRPDSPNPMASPSETTEYTVTAWKGACSGTLTIPVHVNSLPDISVSGDAELCAGEEVQLRASGGVSYRWEPPEGLSDASSPEPIAGPAESTRYRVTATNAEGCEAAAEVYVEIRAIADLRIAVPDTVVQPGDLLRLPLLAEAPADALPLEGLAARLHLRYPARMLSLRGMSNGSWLPVNTSSVVEEVEIITFPATITQTRDTLAFLEFEVYMTSQEEGRVNLEELVLESGRCVRLSGTDGALQLDSVCLPYDLHRFVALSLGLKQNPAAGLVEATLYSSSREAHELALYDSFGRTVWQRRFGGMPSGSLQRAIAIPAHGLSAGIYYLQARNADQMRVVPVMVLD